MSEEHPGAEARLSRERRVAAAIVILVVLLRSLVFLLWEQSYFDSDQAIVGLMAKHLIEGRAFPVFYYGQNYMLGVEAYLAAPVFLVAGVSVATLKFPLLLLNLGIALALLRGLTREVGLRPYAALVPVMFFALPAPVVASEILAPNGGNVAPFVYAMLMWLTRYRPGWCGFFFGLGFLQREFTLYALIALLAVEAIDGELWTRVGLRRRLSMLRAAAEVWLVVQILKAHSSAAGPFTSVADLGRPGDNIVEFTRRFCTDFNAIPLGVSRLFTEHFGVLFGTRPMALAELGIQSAGTQGIPGSWIVLAGAAALAVGVVGRHLLRERQWRREYNFCAYLVLIALLSQMGYIVGRCGGLHHFTLRYELLSTLGLAGLGGWFLLVAPSRRLRSAWIALALGVVLIAAIPTVRLLDEYVRHEPENPKRLMVKHMDARGIKYAFGDYWRAYAITFMTNERIIVAADDFQRIPVYSAIVKEHRSEALRIAREYCAGGKPAMQGFWICPYDPPQ